MFHMLRMGPLTLTATTPDVVYFPLIERECYEWYVGAHAQVEEIQLYIDVVETGVAQLN